MKSEGRKPRPQENKPEDPPLFHPQPLPGNPQPLPEAPGGLEVAPGVRIPETHLRFQFARGGGPGGQNVNKVNTKAELWVPVQALRGLTPAAAARLRKLAGRRLTTADEIHLAAEESRSQAQNREETLRRLRQLIVTALPEPKRRRKTRPSRAARRRRLEGKRIQSEKKARRRGIAEGG